MLCSNLAAADRNRARPPSSAPGPARTTPPASPPTAEPPPPAIPPEPHSPPYTSNSPLSPRKSAPTYSTPNGFPPSYPVPEISHIQPRQLHTEKLNSTGNKPDRQKHQTRQLQHIDPIDPPRPHGEDSAKPSPFAIEIAPAIPNTTRPKHPQQTAPTPAGSASIPKPLTMNPHWYLAEIGPLPH